jgi:peptide/nickel transport system substrate-binding protein
LRTDGKVFGSGVYKLDRLTAKEAVFSVNPRYRGPPKVQNSGATVRFFAHDEKALKRPCSRAVWILPIEAWRRRTSPNWGPPPTSRSGLRVIDSSSAEVQHLVFNLKHPVTGKLGVRKAIAYLVDRQALARDVYQRTVKPLCSVIPAGITGHNTAFFDAYGDGSQQEKAAAALRSEGITGKVQLTLWCGPTGQAEAALREIAGQLNASNLFDATVKTAPRTEYEQGIVDDRRPLGRKAAPPSLRLLNLSPWYRSSACSPVLWPRTPPPQVLVS